MKWLREGMTTGDTLRRLREAPRRVLITDYDGTLAPFVFDRHRARPYPGVIEQLVSIASAGTRLVIISGRSVLDLRKLLQIDAPVELWGTHGWERHTEDGRIITWPVARNHRLGLDEVIGWAEREDLSRHIEIKPASVAIHWRGTDARIREHLQVTTERMMSELAEQTGLELHDFDGGRELRAPGRNKGKAIEDVLKEVTGEAFIAYFGDDLTDEDAFRLLDGRGLRVLVRPEPRDTEADLWLRPPRELQRFFSHWLEAEQAAAGK